MLAVEPASRIGARQFRESDGAPPPALQALHTTLIELYARAPSCDSRIIALDEPAKHAWFAFAHEVESAIAPNGAFAPIRAVASRLAEHAVRLAALIALTEDSLLTALTRDMLARGITLARFYADEALRLSTLRGPALAEKDPVTALHTWLERKYAGQEISLRDVYCFGPPEIRTATVALRAMRQLQVLGFAEDATPAASKLKGRYWRVPAAGGLQPSAA